MATGDLEAQVRLIDSRLSNLDVRMALVENAVSAASKIRDDTDIRTQSNNLPTRMALNEERIKSLNRLMWVILTAIITGMIVTNIQLFMIHK
jgi:hypothetical protein